MIALFLYRIVETPAGVVVVIVPAVVLYILFSISLAQLAGRAGVRSPWLAWIPVAQMFVLAHLTVSEIKQFTRAFVIVSLLEFLIEIALLVFCLYRSVIYPQSFEMTGLDVISGFIAIPALCFFIAFYILYDVFLSQVFKRFSPRQTVVFTVLSAIFFFLGPIFLLVAGFTHSPADGPDAPSPPEEMQSPPTFTPPAGY